MALPKSVAMRDFVIPGGYFGFCVLKESRPPWHRAALLILHKKGQDGKFP